MRLLVSYMWNITNRLPAWQPTRTDLFRRCVKCPNEAPPCPTCDSDEICSLILASCDVCAQTQCTKITANSPPGSTQTSSAHKGSSPVPGAIAGGVIGGVVVIIIITGLVWRFCIKKRRQAFEEQEWRNSQAGMEKDPDAFANQRGARASTHTVASIASTVLTRASNIIQIAYIPGVTNRSVESSPDNMAPPVPPIPAASPSASNASTPQVAQEQHFFMPSDLRDSRFSGYTEDEQTSYGRSSTAPIRSSVASTAYRNHATVNHPPAQIIARGKANAVSVKSSGKNSPTDTPRSVTPPIPQIDFDRHGRMPIESNSPIVARSGVPRAVTVTRSPPTTSSITPPIEISARPSTRPSPSNDENSHSHTSHSINQTPDRDPRRDTGTSSIIDDASTDDEESPAEKSLMGRDFRWQGEDRSQDGSSPRQPGFESFSSVSNSRYSHYKSVSASSPEKPGRLTVESALKDKHKRSGSLNQIIEEAARRASREPRHGGLGSVTAVGRGFDGDGDTDSLASWRLEGPFSDANAARTP